MGVFSYLGFIPWLVTLLAALVAVFLLAKRGGAY